LGSCCKRAKRGYAHQEAIDHYQQALAFLKEQGEHEQAARTLMKLGLTYHTAFQFRHARRAFTLAIDRGTLADVVLVLRGYESPATGGLVPPGMPGHSPGIGLPYDPEGARRVLAEAGYPSGRSFPDVDMQAPQGGEYECEYLQAQWWKNLGVEIS
jgi:ABC-type transport system substrate-binding protein